MRELFYLRWWLWVLCLGLQLGASAPLIAANPSIDFAREIKPILSNACFRCHGPDGAERKGGLRLDTAEGSRADLGGHFAIVPGKPEASELFIRITSTDSDLSMPPKGQGERLSPRDVELISTWIKQGANYSRHWSYVKPSRPPLPAVADPSWVRNDIDRIVLARLDREGLKPSPEADRYALIRRVSLDLTGLPPTFDEVTAFVNDTRSNAYELMVDRTLAKSSYGEHWGLLWLDLARYADSAGYADDPPRRIWLYRDYVIKAFNENKRFDQLTIEQIAGDLLPNPTDDQLTATAFHRNTLTNNEGGTNDEEFRNVAVVDRVNTTMAVWMGTTMACAQCHSHKYDPISQEEYFRFFAFFNNTEDADRGDESPLLSIFTESQKSQRAAWQAEIATLEPTLKTLTPELAASQEKWDTAFPRDVAWRSLKPVTAVSLANSALTIGDDGAVKIPTTDKTDTYTVTIPSTLPDKTPLWALRLDALPEDSLPGKGPGHAGGNFVISKVSAVVDPPCDQPLTGRFVRVELPGDKFLSLAEVQVFSGTDNIALKGEASQISTDFGGEAKRAIDGNTNGKYFEANSTTHTAAGKDPWWEIDLKSAQRIDRIAVWNRLDGVSDRLSNFRVVILDERREPVWKKDVAEPPTLNVEFSITGRRTIEFSKAIADFTQSGFDASDALNNKDPKTKGWAIGGATGSAHSLTLVTRNAIEIPVGSTITVTIEQNSNFANHTLGHFRLSLSDSPHVDTWAQTPSPVIAALQIPAAERNDAQRNEITRHFLNIAPELESVRQKVVSLQKSINDQKPETVPIMKELVNNRRVTKIQHRGNFMDQGKEVTEGTPEAFFPLPADAPRNRLSLAKWLCDQNNPLTSRVIANRYWEYLFGIGIVTSSEEFGSQGDQPTHPELLDWLACELAGIPGSDEGASSTSRLSPWDLKAFLKTIVMSATYRQSSKVTPELVARDPENRLLARGSRFRLSAETLRDQALFVSGLLSSKMYGPPVKPPQPNLGLSAAFGGSTDWQTSQGEDRYRRGIYTTWRRSNPYPSMAAFDAPNREFCTVRRVRTNTPLQALVTLNDPAYIEAAQALSRRIVKEGGPSVEDRANYGFRLILCRPPHQAELARLVKMYEQSLARYRQHPDDAKQMATDPLGMPSESADLSELAAWTVVGNVILNLDETVMKR